MTRKVIILTKRRPSEAAMAAAAAAVAEPTPRNFTVFVLQRRHCCRRRGPSLWRRRHLCPLTVGLKRTCSVQYVVGHLAAAAAPPRYGCALNAAASSQSQSVCSNFLEVKSRFSYAKLFAVSGGDFNEERTIFLCRRSSERVLQS